jgi:hypothetical protein
MNVESAVIYINCPHCDGAIETYVKEINCAIFRHGVYKKNGKQINPHEKKETCDELFNNCEIFGCGKPYKLIKFNDIYKPEICDYI